jgi:hypothetical protein
MFCDGAHSGVCGAQSFDTPPLTHTKSRTSNVGLPSACEDLFKVRLGTLILRNFRGFEFESRDLSQVNEYGPEKDRPDRPNRPCSHESGGETEETG